MFAVDVPTSVYLPPEGVQPEKQLIFYRFQVKTSSTVPSGPRTSRYATPYPLDTRELRKSFYAASKPEMDGTLTVELEPEIPELGYTNLSVQRLRSNRPLLGASLGTPYRPPADMVPTVGDEPCTNNVNHIDPEPDWYDPEPDNVITNNDSCSCRCNLDGTSLGSFRIRISLGEPAKDELSGYLWTVVTRPTQIRASSFNVLGTDNVHAETNDTGTVTIYCSDNGGRTVVVSNAVNGVDILIWLASGELDSIWQIRNPEGDLSTIRVTRYTHLWNATVDETYAIRHDDAGYIVWEQTDNIRGVRRVRREVCDPFDREFVQLEDVKTYLAGRLVREETQTYDRIGEGGSAVRRLVSAEGYDERGAWFKTCTYYNDADHPRRHGKLRSVRSDRSSWTYYDYDANGRETVRIEQLDGSRFPVLEAVALRASLPVDVSAKITVSSYSPGSWDDEDRNDFEMPRLTETYVRKNGGAPVMIGRTQRSYTRETDGYGVPLRRIATTEGFGTAVRTTERVEYPDDAEVPACLRGLEVLAENSDGTVSETMYDFWGDVIEATTYTWFNGVQRPTCAVATSDAEFGHILCEETRLSDNGETIDWIVNCYDDRQRLRSTTYSDGTYETNVYSCCRLLWKQDREGRKTLRSARTGTDSLYYAEEDVWYGCQSWNGDHRVVQHFFDGFGRETNTVTYSSYYDGEAEDPVVPGVWQKPSYRTTVFLDNGGIGESCTVDERGALTDSWGTSSETSEERHVSTSADDISTEECEITYRGGRTETYRSWDGKWTRQIRETTYSVDGNRVETMTTGSSDYGTVTNSVMVFDPLGRMVSFLTPQGMSTLAYDGSTSRVLSETFVSGDVTRVRAYVYDTYGEEVGETIDGVTSRSDVSYEQIGEVWWKVTRDTVSGPEMQNLTTTCEQMTGLGGGLRARTIKNVRGGEKTTHTVNFNADLGLKTEVTASSVSAPVTSYSYYGIEVQRDSAGVTEYTYLDGFGRPVYSERSDQMSWYPVSYKQYDAQGDLTRVEFYTNYWECISESYAYDQRGNRVMAVNANGDEFLSAYDAHGNLVSEDGATYPVRYAYDSQDRRIAMWTNRSGDDWDETRWTYDPATGLLTQKRRADGTTVGYAYTPDGLLETTSCSNGHWTRNVYDSSRQIVGVETNAGDSDEIVRDVFGNETAAQNAVAEYAYALDENGRVTNETVVVGNSVRCLSRAYDRSGRLAGFAVDGNCAAQNLAYREDGLLESISNAEAIVTYAYAQDGRETGFTVSLANGMTFARTVTRDLFLRELVTDVENSIGEDFTYSYDALRRPIARNSDTFAYDERSQVISESYRATTANCFSYDNIGNASFAALGSATNLYVANAVNEYVAVLSDGCEVATAYDAEGNLTTYGEWTYGYDAQNRLATIASNGILVAMNSYDYKGRRVRMVTPDSAYTFVYDGWNVVLELEEGNGTTNRMEYYWGKDISGTLQGAGGIGGLLYLKRNGTIFVPIYDAYGNVMEYRAADGSLVASYAYDAFGRTIAQSGSLADTFRHRHATKFYESETGFYYYGYRHYVPAIARWLTPDPIEEDGGLNLYAFCANNALNRWDALGESWLTDWNTLYCMGDCIERWRLDWIGMSADLMKWSSRAAIIVGPVPKSAFELGHAPAGVSDNTSQLSRGISVVEHLARMLPLGSKVRYGIIRTVGDIRRFMRLKPMVGFAYANQALVVLEGFYDIGVMIYCAGHCYCCDNID